MKKIWQWLKRNLTDRTTRWVFIIVYLIMSFPVWGFYLLGFIFQNKWLLGIASTILAIILGPGTPFLPLCLGISVGIIALIRRFKKR